MFAITEKIYPAPEIYTMKVRTVAGEEFKNPGQFTVVMNIAATIISAVGAGEKAALVLDKFCLSKR